MSPFSTVAELSSALRARKVSSLELTELYLSRLKSLGEAHRAVAQLTEETALRQAKAADAHLAKTGVPKSRLHGIPFGVKDLLATDGIPTRWGSPAHAHQVFRYDATVVSKLYEAGAVLVAKLSMIELAGGGAYNVPWASATGACLSAWDKTRWAGGSSSGSGAATGLGCVGFSIGSETSGSITCPSAFNGVTGFRPTYGRVSRYGAMALCWTMDKIGPMARSAVDCGSVLEVISGPDPKDESTLTERLSLRGRGPKPVIGLLSHDFAGNDASACEKAYSEAVEVFRQLGYTVVDVSLPSFPVGAAVQMIVYAEGSSAHEAFIRGPKLNMLPDPDQIGGLAGGLEIKASDYLWALRMRREALKANSVWEKCDCLFCPVFYHAAVAADKSFDETFAKMGGDRSPANLLGWPSMAFPIGFEDGSPLGGQVIAPALREDICYRVSVDFQSVTDFHRRTPPSL